MQILQIPRRFIQRAKQVLGGISPGLEEKRDPRNNAVIPKRRKRTGGQWYVGMYDSQEEAAQIRDKVFMHQARPMQRAGRDGAVSAQLPARHLRTRHRGDEGVRQY